MDLETDIHTAHLFRRQEWVSRTYFYPLSQRQVLDEILRKASFAKDPVVILDLDSTLYEVTPRTHQILLAWANAPESLPFPDIRTAMSGLTETQVGYSVRDTFEGLGFKSAAPAFESAKDYWTQRFFTNEYLNHDRPYAGAAEYVRQLNAAGIHVAYLTGRDEPGMGEGTLANLIRDGFPVESNASRFLKAERSIEDLAHKQNAAHEIRKLGTVIASLENEPLNVVTLSSLLPESMHVFMETICSDHPAPVGDGLYRLTGF